MTKPQEVARLHDTPMAEQEPDSIMAVIARAAVDPNTNVDKLERLMAMGERVQARQAEQKFNEAMVLVQTEIRPVVADADNPQTRSKYASYQALDRALRPIYTKHGFALSFDTGDGAAENYVKVLCHVSHRAGHSKTYHIDMPADGKGAKGGDVMTKTHAVGSAMSYGARYLLKLIFNVAVEEEEDDGNAAGSGDKISEKQVVLIRSLIDEVGADIEKLCAYFGVDSVPNIKAKDYERVLKALEKKKVRA